MKKTILATTIAILSATAVSAQDMFARMEADVDQNSSVIVFEPLTASADGYVAVFDNHQDEVGRLLGVASVREGANSETRVVLGHPVRQDVIAFLFTGDDFMNPDNAVDSIKIDVE